MLPLSKITLLASLTLSPNVATAVVDFTTLQHEIGWLGLETTDVTLSLAAEAGLDKPQGAVVQRIFAGSPAQQADFRRGDIVMSLNGRRVRNARELENDTFGLKVGSEAQLCVTREDYRTTLYATVALAPPWAVRDKNIFPWLGVIVVDLTADSLDNQRLEEHGKEGGVKVIRVSIDSPAEKAGMQTGDVIMSFNDRKTRNVREFLTDLMGANIGNPVRICIMREDIRKTLHPILESKPLYIVDFVSGEVFDFINDNLLNERYLREVLPTATSFQRSFEPVPHYKAYKASGEPAGVAFITTEVCPEQTWGYQSAISVLVGVEIDGRITGVRILEQSENTKYTRGLLDQFATQYIGRDVTTSLVLGQNIDAITGATISSNAINRSINKSSSMIAPLVLKKGFSDGTRLGVESLSFCDIIWQPDFFLLLLIIATAIWGYRIENRPFRYFVLGMSLIYIGIIKGGGLSIHDILGVTQRGYFAKTLIADNFFRYGLLLIAFGSAIIMGRLYCGWLCPFGFVLEVVHRLGGIRKPIPIRIDSWMRSIKYVILVAILFVAFVAQDSAAASVMAMATEPYDTLFKLSGNILEWAYLVAILISSILFSRAYCRYLCPLGAFLAFVSLVSSFTKKMIGIRYVPPRHFGRCPTDAIRYDKMFKEIQIDNNECIKCNEGITEQDATRSFREAHHLRNPRS